MPIGIIVHGGAGRFWEDEYTDAEAACAQAAREAHVALAQGGSALDAVEIAVRAMEAAPVLNAGHGATINEQGEVELDALIQDGATQTFGAVAGVQRIKHPVTLARLIMERTPHHFLIGRGAEKFAEAQGMPLIDPASLLTERRLKGEPSTQDTVGAVALDRHGQMAAAVSTGGVRGKMAGRVGDSPIAGAGAYADNNLGAACATGLGEGIMRSLLTFRAVQSLQSLDAQTAADEAVRVFTERWQGLGGIIVLDPTGRIGFAFNTHDMPVAFLQDDKIQQRKG